MRKAIQDRINKATILAYKQGRPPKYHIPPSPALEAAEAALGLLGVPVDPAVRTAPASVKKNDANGKHPASSPTLKTAPNAFESTPTPVVDVLADTGLDQVAEERIGSSVPSSSPAPAQIKFTPAPSGPLSTGFQFTARQLQANEIMGSQRNTLLVGGARSGKTFVIVRAIIVRALKAPGSRHVIFRFHTNAIRRSIWLDTLPKVLRLCFPGLMAKCQTHTQEGYLTLPNGSEIWISGLDDKDRVEKILGQEFSSIVFNECSQIPYHSVVMALTRLAQRSPGISNRVFYDLNPVGKGHWTYRLFTQHLSPDSLERIDNPEDYACFYINPKDNLANIDPEFIKTMERMPERYRRRFLDGQYVEEAENALWTLEGIERNRVSPEDVPQLVRIVIPVDPSGASGEFDLSADAIGIGAIGLSQTGHLYVLEDLTCLQSPEKWGRIAVNAYHRWQADRIVAEKNFGGDMVRAVIQRVEPVPVTLVTASRGKVQRAEPISALADMGRIHHVGRFPELEEELCNFTKAGYLGSRSPNRADWLIWGATELSENSGIYGLNEVMRTVEQTLKDYKSSGDPVPSAARVLEGMAGASGLSEPAGDSGRPFGKATGLDPRNFDEDAFDKVQRSSFIKPDVPSNAPRCPNCDSPAVVRLPGNGSRCNGCGIQFGGPSATSNALASPASRTGYLSGWKD